MTGKLYVDGVPIDNWTIRLNHPPDVWLTMPDHLEAHPITGLPTYESLLEHGYTWHVSYNHWGMAPTYWPGQFDIETGRAGPPCIVLSPLDAIWIDHYDVVTQEAFRFLIDETIQRKINKSFEAACYRIDQMVEQSHVNAIRGRRAYFMRAGESPLVPVFLEARTRPGEAKALIRI